MNNKLVSIACRCYNAEKTIAKTIEAVLNQTYKNWELIICDDNSTDNTENIISQFNDSRIKYYKNDKNIGIIANLNKALSLCSGDYISILDGDDCYYPQKLELQVNFLNENLDYGAVFSYIDIDYNKKYEKTAKTLLKLINQPSGSRAEMLQKIFFSENFLAFPTEMFRREFLVKLPDSIIATGDCNFHIHMLFHSKIKVLEIPLVKYKIHGNNTAFWITKEVLIAENIYLLHHFSKMSDVNLFQEVFSKYYEKTRTSIDIKDIPYLIARISILYSHRYLAGVYLLQCLFEDSNYFSYIMDKFNLTYKDFINLRRSSLISKTKKKRILGFCYFKEQKKKEYIQKTFFYIYKERIYSDKVECYLFGKPIKIKNSQQDNK